MHGNMQQMTLVELYQSQLGIGEEGKNARDLLKQTHWFTVNAEFDPKTGEALPQGLSTYLAKIVSATSSGPLRDRLWRITEHVRPSIERLFHSLNQSPRREHALLPVHAVRELDANSFIKLSNRPGRTIREKLAGKPYLQAVRRFQSIDLPENRLFKAFVIRLTELLKMRQEYLGDLEDEVLPKIQAWLTTDEASAIARWENLPPNNTLLSHRDYRRIWDAWRWLQTLDDDIARDLSQLEVREQTMRLWSDYGNMYSEGEYLFADMPVLFDYEKFEIRPWLPSLAFQNAKRRVDRSSGTSELVVPSCVDLVALHPCYATPNSSSKSLRENYLWQQWKDNDRTIDLDLSDSDAAYLHPDATTISLIDLFLSKDNSAELLDRAARAYAHRLRISFKNDSFIWLIPDFLNDFELEITRRNLNASFADAEPLPRSVAAVVEQFDYTKINRDGFSVVMVDTIGDKTCATKLIARHDKELQQRVPETRGYYWERCPPVIISREESNGVEEKLYNFITVDEQGTWQYPVQPAQPQLVKPYSLKGDSRIGQFDACIHVVQSPVVGGIRLHSLQQRAREIPLWRDQIPELSMKVIRDGRYQRFYLVSRGTTIKPIRGVSVLIPVDEAFTLPAGKPFYQFPLFQGESAEELGFSARLDSPAFPLKEDVVCRLNLTFEYGSDEPYKLTFCPINSLLPPVRVTWRRTEEAIVTDAPSPEYPRPMAWADMRQVPKRESQERSDLLEWVLNAILRLDKELFLRPDPRETGMITSHWREDKNGNHFTFVRCDNYDEDVFIHESALVEGLFYEDFDKGDELSFEIQERGGRYSGRNVAGTDSDGPPTTPQLRSFNENTTKSVVSNIRMRLYFPIIQIWRDGHSIYEAECPSEFSKVMREEIQYLTSLLQYDGIPDLIHRELLFLLACMHRDMPDECVEWILDQVENGRIRNVQAVSFALGDMSEEWQGHVLSQLVANPTKDALRVFAYAIWREQQFVHNFTLSELELILDGLNLMLGQVQPCPRSRYEDDNWTIRNWVRAIAEPLELLLGLLRTRSSTNPDIRMALQPHQRITKELAKQVERVTELVAQSNVTLFSRVQINLQKPDVDRTPDLLYALRLYLTGDDGANAIHITSVSDGDSGS